MNWLSGYNYDSAIASIPIQIILIVFYLIRKNLPLRQSRSFGMIMFTNLLMTTFDLVSCELNEIWTRYPLWFMYAVNIGYFLFFVLRSWYLFDYTAEACYAYTKLGKVEWAGTKIPVILMTVNILLTPFTHLLFVVDPDKGYYNTISYPTIYWTVWFYIIASILYIFALWNKIDHLKRMSLLACNFILVVGILMRHSFMDTLVTSYFSILAILVIYMTAQNPDLYKERKIGVFNTDALTEISQEFESKNIPFSTLVITISDYATSRNIYGSEQVTKALQRAASWMMAQNTSNTVFYLGNGTFTVINHGKTLADEEAMKHFWGGIAARFAEPWIGKDTNVTFAVRGAYIPNFVGKDSQHDLAEYIDFALRRNQSNERGTLFILDDENVERMTRENQVECAIERAIREHSMQVYLQPLYSTKEKRITGAEALARLEDPELGFIPPMEFIDAAEKNGSILELGFQIYEKVCIFLEQNDPEKLGLSFINVNLSPAQCMSDTIAEDLIAIAKAHHVDMHYLDFEITESILAEVAPIHHVIEQLKAEGATVSLDDFGTGYSNITRVMELPFNVIKIDMSIIWAYFKKENNALPYIMQMFHNGGFAVVAEGVEDEEMSRVLTEMQCEYLQGYYYSRPVPPFDFLKLLRR